MSKCTILTKGKAKLAARAAPAEELKGKIDNLTFEDKMQFYRDMKGDQMAKLHLNQKIWLKEQAI